MSELLAGADISGLPQRGKVVVGFSGGADSTALAHWLLGRLGPERLVLAQLRLRPLLRNPLRLAVERQGVLQ